MNVFGLADRDWILLSAAFYAAGFVYGLLSLVRRRRQATGMMYVLAAIGFVLQTGGLELRGMATHGCPLGNRFEIVQFTVWSTVLLYFVIGPAFRMSVVGFFCAGLAATLSSLSLIAPTWDGLLHEKVFGNNPWVALHAAVAVFSYGVFGLLALTSLMYLLQSRNLRRKHLGGLFSLLPSIVELDQMNIRLLGFGVVLLTLSLAVGSIYWAGDPPSVHMAKLVVTIAVWAAYLIVLLLRVRQHLITRRFAWVCVLLFLASLLSLEPVNASRRPLPAGPSTSGVRPPLLVVAAQHLPVEGGPGSVRLQRHEEGQPRGIDRP